MAAAFATLPCKVLWRLTAKEIPDASAIADLKLSNNTKVSTLSACYFPACVKCCEQHARLLCLMCINSFAMPHLVVSWGTGGSCDAKQ